jgi:TolA-binding protein
VPDYAGAKALFDQVIADYPTSARDDDAAFYSALCLYEQGLYPAARDAFLAFRTNDSGSPFVDDAAYYTGRCRFELATVAADFDAANVDFVAVDPMGSNGGNAAYFSGRCAYEVAGLAATSTAASASYAVARQRLQAFATSFSTSTNLDAGRYYLGRSFFDDALQTAVTASVPTLLNGATAPFGQVSTATASGYADNATYYLGRTQYELGQYSTAKTTLRSVATRFPASIFIDQALYFAGRAGFSVLDYRGAIDDFRASIANNPLGLYADNAAFYIGRSFFEMGLGAGAGATRTTNYGLAETEFRNFVNNAQYAQSSFLDSSQYYLGRSIYGLTRYPDAVAPFSAVVTTAGSPTPSVYVPSSLYYRGRSHYQIGTTTTDIDAAIADFHRVEVDFPTNQYADNSLRYEAQSYANYVPAQCVQARAVYDQLVTRFPASAEVARANTYLSGKGCP